MEMIIETPTPLSRLKPTIVQRHSKYSASFTPPYHVYATRWDIVLPEVSVYNLLPESLRRQMMHIASFAFREYYRGDRPAGPRPPRYLLWA